MTDQTATRTEISARLMAVAEHTIVAEWICCEPLDPTHDLCAKGYATLEMTRALLVDDPEASVTAAPLLDAVMGLLPAAVPVPPPADQTAPLAQVWVVWREDERAHGYFATEDAAKRATIDCWEEDEPSCPDYSWRRDGPRWELVVGGEHGGVYASRHRVYGAPEPAEVLAVLPEQTDRAQVDSLGREADRLRKDWVEMLARAERVEAEVERLRAVQAAALSLTAAERTMLNYALNQAQLRLWRHGPATEEDQAALNSLRRVAAEEQPAETPMFGSPDCTCIPFTRQGGTPRYCGPTDTVDMISGWEIGRDCPHHKPAVGEQPETQEARHLGGRANAEDCPACEGTNPPYPFLCPGPDAP